MCVCVFSCLPLNRISFASILHCAAAFWVEPADKFVISTWVLLCAVLTKTYCEAHFSEFDRLKFNSIEQIKMKYLIWIVQWPNLSHVHTNTHIHKTSQISWKCTVYCIYIFSHRFVRNECRGYWSQSIYDINLSGTHRNLISMQTIYKIQETVNHNTYNVLN